MAIEDDFSVATNGDIRYTGNTTSTYTVLELHRFLQDLADDPQASGDDLVDITSSTPSERATDNIVSLNSPYNIDDTAARYLYDGSITQDDGDTVYSGLRVLSGPNTGTELMIVQDDEILPSYWGTGINAVGGDYMRVMIKTRTGGADIDGKRILVVAREEGDAFAEFPVTLGQGNSVAAVPTSDDLNNDTLRATVETWTTIVFTEGLRLIDIDNDTVNEEYYCEFDKGSQSLNDTYEWAKWQSARSLITLNGTDTGTDYAINDGTISGQAQSFTSRGQAEVLTEARFRIKVGLGTPTNDIIAHLYATTAGVIPTGGILTSAEPVLATVVTDRASPTTYKEVIFRFNGDYEMTASTQYAIVLRNTGADASNYFEVEGAATGSVAGENKSQDSGGWTAQASADLWFTVKSSPTLFSRAGERHRGVTHQVPYTAQTGTFTEGEIVFWGTAVTYDNLASGSFVVGNYVTFEPSGGGAVKNAGKVLKNTGTVLTVALESTAANLLDNDIIRKVGGATTADVNVTIADQDKAGGEGVILADGDDGATGDIYIQLIHGAAPVNTLGLEGRTSGATATASAPTSRTISPAFIGQSTGSNLIGAYGVGFDTNDIGSSDLFFDLTNTDRTPPNNVTFTVTGLVSGEDRVLVGPRAAGVLDKDQFTTDTALTAAAETVVSIATVAIPTDTPGAGEGASNTRLRVQRDSGVYKRQPYSSFDGATPGNFTMSLPDSGSGGIQLDVVASAGTITRGSGSFLDDGFEEDCRFTGSGFTNGGNNATFTVASVTALVITVVNNAGMVDETGSGDERVLADGWDYSADNAASGNEVFVAYIDTLADAATESYTAVYNTDRDLFVRVRDGGATPIKTFESPAIFGSTSSSIPATRTTDA